MAIPFPPMDIEVNHLGLATGTLEVTTDLKEIGSGSIFRGSATNDILGLQWITNTYRYWFTFLVRRRLWLYMAD
jgi:hypothetical protein